MIYGSMDRLPGEWPRKAQRQRVIAKAGSWLCTKDRLHLRPGWTTGQTAAMSENPTSYLLREDMATANTAPLPRGKLVRQMPSRYSASCSGRIPAFACEGKIGSLAEIL